MPIALESQATVPPPAYHRMQARLGAALHVDALVFRQAGPAAGTGETDNVWVYVNFKWPESRQKEPYSAPNDSTVIQRAAAAALTGPQTCVTKMRQTYHRRRDLAVSLL